MSGDSEPRDTHGTYPLVALLLAVLVVGCASFSTGGAPTLTVDNRDDARYRVTAYAVPEVEDATDVTFRATNVDGDRPVVGVADLRDGDPYRNVTVARDYHEVRDRQVLAAPTGNTSATVESWDPDAATVYVVETTDADESLVGVGRPV